MARTGMTGWVRDRLRRALGVTDLAGRLEHLDRNLNQLRHGLLDTPPSPPPPLPPQTVPPPSPPVVQSDPHVAELLKAESEGRLIKLEYPPSYDFRARWGYSRPSHPGFMELFGRHTDTYRKHLRGMVELLPHLKQINRHFSHDLKGVAGWMGGPINMIDTALLYYFVTLYKPRTYLEIGSGLTTLFAARAVKDHNLPTRIVSIDPNPRALVDGVCDEVIREPFEVGDLSVFDRLEPGDIVFMDGSHRTFPNSDVTVFMLDVLPKLKPGVIIHFHDIVLPDDYPQMFVEWYWSEQYILGAYLLGMGDRVEHLMPSYYASIKMPDYRDIIRPILDWWGDERIDMWLAGGSIWFTHAPERIHG